LFEGNDTIAVATLGNSHKNDKNIPKIANKALSLLNVLERYVIAPHNTNRKPSLFRLVSRMWPKP